MDSSDGPEHIIPIDATWTVDRDGTATETSVRPGRDWSKTTELSASELRLIKDALTGIDIEALTERFGTQKEGDGTTVVAYRGQTVTLDSRIMGFSPPGEAPRVARSFVRLTGVLTTALENPRGADKSSAGPG